MSKFLLVISMTILLASGLLSQSYLGTQRSLQLSLDEAGELSGAGENLDQMASYFFKMNYDDVLSKTKAAGITPETTAGTIFVDGKRFRMDMTSMGEKMSAILNLETREIVSIMHQRKEYFVMNLDEIKEMKKNMAAQMENMQGMMDNLPPEAKAMMEKMTGKKQAPPPKIEYTGKKKTINGFPCEEVLVTKQNGMQQLWITLKHKNLRNLFYELTHAIPMEDEENKAQWEIIKEGWPPQASSIVGNEGYMDGHYSINEISSLEETSHKAGTFDPPAGYTKKTMQDMMGGMPGYQQ